jgi:hypothetical protein
MKGPRFGFASGRVPSLSSCFNVEPIQSAPFTSEVACKGQNGKMVWGHPLGSHSGSTALLSVLFWDQSGLHGRRIGSGLPFGDSVDAKGVLNCNVPVACCAELLDVEKFCEADPMAPN